MEAMSIDFKNEALNLVVLLENATGAVFENEKLAIDIVEETLKKILNCPIKTKARNFYNRDGYWPHPLEDAADYEQE